jgi:hypothetical protein
VIHEYLIMVFLDKLLLVKPRQSRSKTRPDGSRPTIEFLGASTPSNWTHWTAAFVQRLRELGWIEGRTVAIEYRWAEGRSERFGEITAEFVRLNVDVIVTVGSAVPAAREATSTLPIVFALAVDPVGSGLVASLARPGGNVTGLSIQSTDLVGKRIEGRPVGSDGLLPHCCCSISRREPRSRSKPPKSRASASYRLMWPPEVRSRTMSNAD